MIDPRDLFDSDLTEAGPEPDLGRILVMLDPKVLLADQDPARLLTEMAAASLVALLGLPGAEVAAAA